MWPDYVRNSQNNLNCQGRLDHFWNGTFSNYLPFNFGFQKSNQDFLANCYQKEFPEYYQNYQKAETETCDCNFKRNPVQQNWAFSNPSNSSNYYHDPQKAAQLMDYAKTVNNDNFINHSSFQHDLKFENADLFSGVALIDQKKQVRFENLCEDLFGMVIF